MEMPHREPENTEPLTDRELTEQRLKEIFDRLHGTAMPETYGDRASIFSKQLQTIASLVPSLTDEGMTILYPGSATHTDVASFFGAGRVMHVDTDQHAMDAMREAGYKTDCQSIESYAPDMPADIIVSYNAGTLEAETIDRLLAPGGYIIANNWHGSANAISEMEDFELLGAVAPGADDAIDTDTAARGLGTETITIPGLPDDIEQNKNTEALWLFRRKAVPGN